MTPRDLLAKHGIRLESTTPGRHYITCPKCSAGRSREHQKLEVLGVTIDGDKVGWGCNHCGWTGPEKGSGHRERTSAVYYTYGEKLRKARGANKQFWWEHLDGNGRWAKGTGGADTKIMYRIDDVRRAISEDRVIAIVEGEKDADTLWHVGIPATCNAHGASEPGKKPKWLRAHSAYLAGADLVVLNDNDPAGYEHTEAICKQSAGVAKRIRRLDLALHWPEIPKGGDVSDWLDQGHTREELDALIEAAPDYVSAGPSGEASASEAPPIYDDAEIARLAKLSMLQYEKERKVAAEKLNVRAPILDRLVDAERDKLGLNQDDDDKQGRAVSLPEPEPWSEAVDGAELLDGLATAVRRHVVLSDTGRDAAALWTMHAYLVEIFPISPRLGVVSPTKRCGKTTLLDVLGCLVLRPLPTANVTAAALFRVIEMYHPTLLVDEADTFIRDSDELRGVLNSGHRKGGQVLRTVGDDYEPRAFSTYGACAVALIGQLPDTLNDRAVAIELKRRLKTESIEPFRIDRAGHLNVLARKSARWAADHATRIGEIDPAVPEGIINREADNWRPLLAIAEAAGGDWPERARRAAEAAHSAGGEGEAAPIEALLGDINGIFAEKGIRAEEGEDKITSADLVEALVKIEGHPWAEMGRARKPLTQTRLARMLKPLGIAPAKIRVADKTPNGYLATLFDDAFARFCPEGGVEPEHRNKADEQRASETFQTGTFSPDVPVAKCEKSNNDGQSSGVPVVKGGIGAKGTSKRAIDATDGAAAQRATHEIGLPQRRIDALSEWYEDTFYERRDEPEITATLDRELRLRLDEHGVLPEFIEVEAERVIERIFAPISSRG
jgi:putative DNA primase/helicase